MELVLFDHLPGCVNCDRHQCDENEYALLLVAERERRKVQHGCDDCQDIYDYLDRIRENGFRVSFGKRTDGDDKEDEYSEADIDEKQVRRLLKWLEMTGQLDAIKNNP